MLHKAGIDPQSFKTWSGYISAESKLRDDALNDDDRMIQGIHLLNASHDLDLLHSYLWMLGREILKLLQGHPVKDIYWFPAYNSTQRMQALEFLRRHIDSGIKPQSIPAEKGFVTRILQ